LNADLSTKLPWEKLKTYDLDYVEQVEPSLIGRIITARVPLSRFRDVTQMNQLNFERGESHKVRFCETPIGKVYLDDTIDISQKVDIVLLDDGELWATNQLLPQA
jgi:hypothetical protein